MSSTPSTTIWPFWCSSSRLMQRIIVDLPEPDGPQMTMRSPRMTLQVDVVQHVKLAVPLVHADDLDGDVGFRMRLQGVESWPLVAFAHKELYALVCGLCRACVPRCME